MKSAPLALYTLYHACFGLLVMFFFFLTLTSEHTPAQIAAYRLSYVFTIFLVTLCCLEWRYTRHLLTAFARRIKRISSLPAHWYVGGCAIGFLLLAASISQGVFGGIPHVGDTHAQFVHAKIFASGHFYLDSHPLRQFFDFQNMINDGRYYSVYAPGHAAMLAIGHLTGAPWLINPALGSLTVIAVYLLAREIGGKSAGFTAATLMLVSPFVVFMSSEYMNNVTCMLFLTLFLFCYIRQHKTGSWRYAIAAGLCVGYAFITRPQSTLPFALPMAFHAMGILVQNPGKHFARTLCMAMAFTLFVALLLGYNVIMNGNPWVMSQTDPTKFITHLTSTESILKRLPDDIARLNKTVSSLHAYLFGWPTSSLIFVMLLFMFQGQQRYGTLLIVCCLSQLASLIINPFYSMIFGPRYLYETSSSLIVLTALCLVRMPAIIRNRLHTRLPYGATRGAITIMIAALFLMAFPSHILSRYKDYKNHYWEGNADFYHNVMRNVQTPALVFCTSYKNFRWVYFMGPPLDSNPVIVALDKGKENQKLMEYYPDRHVYLASDTETIRIR